MSSTIYVFVWLISFGFGAPLYEPAPVTTTVEVARTRSETVRQGAPRAPTADDFRGQKYFRRF